MIIAKSYNRALKCFASRFYARMGAVGGRDITAYRGIMKFSLDAVVCEIYKIFTEAGDEICARRVKHKISL